MTGFGKASAEITGRTLTIEVKTLNSKQLDLILKIPGSLREKEWEIRQLLTQQLERGKVECYIGVEANSEAAGISINRLLARSYHAELKSLAAELGESAGAELFAQVLRMPDVLQSGRDEILDDDWPAVFTAIREAIARADEFRRGEGAILEKDIAARVQFILAYLDEVTPLESGRTASLRERIRADFGRMAADLTVKSPDPDRFEHELIFYIEKLDITEEKVRLKKHCDYFLETLAEPVSQGKKLGFLVQEMGREINTIGSKAAEAGIQKRVVQMKDELEKIREQLGNIL